MNPFRRPHGRPFNAFLFVFICVHLWLLFSLSIRAEPLVIRHIAIEGNTRTRTDVIRRELLFHPGDVLDTLAVAETERNLRRLYFLGDVRIRVARDSTGADVTVHVRDLYARALSPLLSGNVHELSYGLTALDFNLLGRGQTAQLTLFHDAVTSNSADLYYRNPRLRASRLALTADLGVADEGHHIDLSLAQPFYALAAPWSYGLAVYDQAQIQRRYSAGALTARYTDRLSGGSVWLVRSFGDRVKIRPGAQIGLSDRRFAPEPGYAYAPQNRRRLLPALTLTVWQPRYDEQTFVRELGRPEDLQIGSWIETALGLSSTALGSDQTFLFYHLQLAPRFKIRSLYAFAECALDGRRQNGADADRLFHAELSLYARIENRHVLALRARFDALSRPEDADQLLLGLNRGLRGYLPRRFDGTRRYTFNIEARPTVYRHALFTLGGAAFVDAGDAWTPGQTAAAFNAAAGFGLRLASTRVYNQPILRTDLAYAFRDRAWQISFGLGHYF